MTDERVYLVCSKLYQLGDCEPLAPKLYAATDSKAFVLEDFSIQGYKPGHGKNQLDLDQIQASLILLAKYHALGCKYLQTLNKDDPRMSLIQSYQPILIIKPREYSFQTFFELLKPYVKDDLYEKILNMKNQILAEPVLAKYPAENSMTVIIHADYRTSNILFKKNDAGTEIQVKLIDWQYSKEANPVLDLIYFFVTSVPIEIFKANDNKFKNLYLKTLKKILSSMQSSCTYDRPELDRDMLYYNYFYLKILLIDWPLILGINSMGAETEYVSNAVEWVYYFEGKGII